jgi:hypothetical protein
MNDRSPGLWRALAPWESQSVATRGPRAGPRLASPSNRRDRFGGTDGNEILTNAAALLLTVLLLAEGVTILRIGGLVSAHMFIGMILIPPVLLKLSSTGYRFVRYYTGARSYREKGPPLLALRILAPVLVATTVIIFATGVWLMLLGHRSDQILLLHKVSFIIWGAVFAIHFLAYLPRMARSLRADWTTSRKQEVPATHLRTMLLAASLGTGLALALSVLSLINGWHSHHHLF